VTPGALTRPRPHPGRATPLQDALLRGFHGMSSAISLIDVGDPAQPVVYVNPAFEALTGYAAAEAVGRPWTIVEGPDTDPGTAAELRLAIRGGDEHRVRVRHHRRDGTRYWSETFLSPVRDEAGQVTHYLSVQKDVTAQAEADRRAARLAYYDALTGLPNRWQAEEHLGSALARARRTGNAVAVLFLDLDRFKPANDRHGHDAGDRLLGRMAARWREVGRAGDVLARYGGDEFLLVMADLDRGRARLDAAAAAERYIAVTRRPVELPGTCEEPIELSVSVGIAVFPEDGEAAGELIVAADAAMYRAKRRGGGGAAWVR
jgi:diguanylate cyclase (GGDEF)-like protein/PAS domain S-box-containing protein